jgi:hypothetical protein
MEEQKMGDFWFWREQDWTCPKYDEGQLATSKTPPKLEIKSPCPVPESLAGPRRR